MKVINMLKDFRNETIEIASKINAEPFLMGDAFLNEADFFVITVPVNYKNEVDDKFIRFINKFPDKIKMTIIIFNGISETVINENDIKCKYIVKVDINDNYSKITEEINNTLNIMRGGYNI